MCVYSDADVRLARRIRRDTVERGRDVHGVIEQVGINPSHLSPDAPMNKPCLTLALRLTSPISTK